MINKYFIMGAVALIIIVLVNKKMQRKKYTDFFIKELGFGEGFMSKFTTQELKDTHQYLTEYRNLKKDIETNPALFERIKTINRKYDIFTSI